MRKFLKWLGNREIVKTEIIAYKTGLLEKYEAMSINSMLSAINCYLKYIGRSECKVKIIKIQKDIYASEEKELSYKEYKRLIEASKKNVRLKLLMQTICSTGIRVSEHRFITVKAICEGKAYVESKGKRRTVWLPHKLCMILKTYAKKKNIRSGSIFVTAKGKLWNRCRIWAEMKKLCQIANVQAEKVFPHNLRHLFARMYYSMEKDIVRLADILGHASINTTRIYTRDSGKVHRQHIEKMALTYIT